MRRAFLPFLPWRIRYVRYSAVILPPGDIRIRGGHRPRRRWGFCEQVIEQRGKP